MNESANAPEGGEQREEGQGESYTSAAEEEKRRLLAELDVRQQGFAAQRARNRDKRTRRLYISIVVAVILAIAVIGGGWYYLRDLQHIAPLP